MDKSMLNLIQSQLPGWMAAAKTPGAAVALIQPGDSTGYACAGIQDSTNCHPVTPQTVFEAASLGKPVFACLVLQMVREGKLDLDCVLSDWLPKPWVPNDDRLRQITVRRVLSHSCGFPNWFGDENPRVFRFPPGERFGYSGEGYLYLQRVVEAITGQLLEDLARQSLFDPLGMTRTRYTCPPDLAAETAQGHAADGRPMPKWQPGANAAASLHTTLADYSRFLQAVLAGEDPLEGLGQEMLVWQTPIDERSAWGLGWGLKHLAGDLFFWQWGDSDGWKHVAVGSLARGEGVIVLTNGEQGYQVWKQVLRATFDPADEIAAWLEWLDKRR